MIDLVSLSSNAKGYVLRYRPDLEQYLDYASNWDEAWEINYLSVFQPVSPVALYESFKGNVPAIKSRLENEAQRKRLLILEEEQRQRKLESERRAAEKQARADKRVRFKETASQLNGRYDVQIWMGTSQMEVSPDLQFLLKDGVGSWNDDIVTFMEPPIRSLYLNDVSKMGRTTFRAKLQGKLDPYCIIFESNGDDVIELNAIEAPGCSNMDIKIRLKKTANLQRP